MRLKTRDIILVSLFAALTAIGAYIKIPTPIVPFTMQFIFCAYSGILLGARLGFLSQLLYVLIGLMGIPVFTNGGGITYIFQPTFGYLLGFILCSYSIGKMRESIKDLTFLKTLLITLVGLSILYTIGVTYLYFIMKYYLNAGYFTFQRAISVGFIPFILGDFISCLIVAGTSVKVVPVLKKHSFTL